MRYEMTPNEIRVLTILKQGPCSASYIGKCCKFKPNQVSLAIAGLNELNYTVKSERGIYNLTEDDV